MRDYALLFLIVSLSLVSFGCWQYQPPPEDYSDSNEDACEDLVDELNDLWCIEELGIDYMDVLDCPQYRDFDDDDLSNYFSCLLGATHCTDGWLDLDEWGDCDHLAD